MLGIVSAALEGQGAVIVARLPIAETIAAIKSADAAMALVIVGPELPAVDRAMVLAAIAPLAVARAPRRLCALDIGHHAAEADVVAVARFLAGAKSTTGQVLVVGG
ncbi:Rossmann fold domain-containing protein [Sphingomonas qilianensis]|uniref:Rossmann fold domain-containing protein n=1 Tax=Sphingomonas qilianensis TaxID=1736690 RepID=A0ABU9XP80_9SPHN